MIGHILSEEQSLDGSDGVSDDGHLTIVQCDPYHQPPSSDLYWTSVKILPLLRYHQQICILIIAITNQHHALFYCSTTRAPPHSTHIPCRRPIISCTHQFSRSWVLVATRTCEDLVSTLLHPSEYEYFCYMFHSTTICFPNYLLICSCPYLYKYSSCSMYFASLNINLATYFS